MRVPIYLVIPACLAVIGVTWWFNLRGMDFLAPPPESELAAIRARVEASLPRPERADDLPQVDTSEPQPEPEIDLGDLSAPPVLHAYTERSHQGTEHFLQLAEALEGRGQFQRALLAWERVLDQPGSQPEQMASAIAALRRLRPTLPSWNSDPKESIPVVLHAGTGPSLGKDLKPVLEDVAKELTRASSGVLQVSSALATGRADIATDGPVPVALWLAGPEKGNPSTEVLSFTVSSPDTLRQEVLQTAFQLIRTQLKRATSVRPPAPLEEAEEPSDAFTFRVTRLSWEEFGKSLNPSLPPESVQPE